MRKVSLMFPFTQVKGSMAAIVWIAAMWLGTANVVMAQDSETSTSTETTLSGINDLSGIDPSTGLCTTGRPETDNSKIFCFYNAASNKFLSIGGAWGTHASLNSTPNAIWLETSGSGYKLNNRVEGSGTGTYLGVQNGDLWMDKGLQGTSASTFVFEKADGYTDNNKVYRIKASDVNKYITVYPNNSEKYCNVDNSYETTNSAYQNQVWKIISKQEYYELFFITPAHMKSVVDATFLMKAPGFRVNNTDAANWKIGREDQHTNIQQSIFFGDAKMYKDYTKVSTTNWSNNTYNGNHQQNCGKYFYCYTKGLRNFYVYQDVTVHKAGWYVIRCNGFSTSNSMENIKQNGKPLAYLFTAVLDKNTNYPVIATATSSTLNVISQDEADALAAQNDGAGIGVAFYNGKYENQVQICVEKDADGNAVSSEHPVTLRIGFFVDPTQDGASDVTAEEITAVDNFKLLYAGPRRNPELILDEESTDLRYLTEATDDYTNSVLHLNRKLNDNMWNSLILPVDLTFGQMKRTFGDAVKVAKLAALTNHVVQFVTVEPTSDDDVMVMAFEPYIVYPPVVNVTSQAYTADKFYTTAGDDNSQWLGTDYQPTSDESNHLSKTIQANHYDITMVSFDREGFKKHVNTDSWVSDTKLTGEGASGKMECLGTMAKTYDDSGIIEGRDNLNGDYFMYKGKLIQVPNGKDGNGEDYFYGLKAFRCWFELKANATADSKFSLFIDGIEDSATSIDNIYTTGDITSYKRGLEGVFNMNGQMVRHGNSVENLPSGLYIVNGKKIAVK